VHLDVIFYQSRELREQAATLLNMPLETLKSGGRHVVLPRGIQEPPPLPKNAVRAQVRRELGLDEEKILALSVGRVTRTKGIYELIEAMAVARKRDPRIVSAVVGAMPAFDESRAVEKYLEQHADLETSVRLLPTCEPEKVWRYLCAADLFVFTSHHEGMPNSLLEAMAMGVPAVAFGIAPVLEIDGGAGALIPVAPLNVPLFAEAVLRLAQSPKERIRLGQMGRRTVLDRFMTRKNMAVALERLAQLLPMANPAIAV
jgi:glycosyltransferase involved in cell wall biosynthesis